jgi:hypothetical protein
MRLVSLFVAWVVLLVVLVLSLTGAISSATQLFVNALVVGYGLGRIHALHGEMRQDTRRTAALLSDLVDQMGTALASCDLSDEEQTALQRQRTDVLALLAVIDRPPLHQRVLARLRR